MPRIEILTWRDAYNKEGEWRSVKSLTKLKPAIIVTVGFVVHEDDDGVVTCSDIDTEDYKDVHGVSYVPKCMIVSRQVLQDSN